MVRKTGMWWFALLAALVLSGCGGKTERTPATPANGAQTAASGAASALSGRIDEFGAGTLAAPFTALNKQLAQAHPGLDVRAQFGGSVAMVKQVTELGKNGDVVAVADYSVIPAQMFGIGGKQRSATWYAGFVSNAITFVYTSKSKGAGTINAKNWYQVLSEPGVRIGRSNPDTDPSGYQTLQMLKLAEQYYHQPGLAARILANSPPQDLRDTETDLIAALESGQIDYLAIYRSDALQHHFEYLKLPPEINLSDASKASLYKSVSVQTKNGVQAGKPIIYAVTVPSTAAHPQAAVAYVKALLGPQGQDVMRASGFTVISPALAAGEGLPASLKSVTMPWPGS